MVTTARVGMVALALVVSAPAVRAQAAPAARAQAAPAIPAADRPQYIRVIAKDYTFDAPVTVQAGVATIHLLNQGADIHHLTVQELPAGKTVKDFFDVMRSTGLPPTWSKSLGQTMMIPNGGEAFIAFRLPPGRYVLSCVMPASDGRSHVAKGMYQLITATSAPVAAAPRPAAASAPRPAVQSPRPAAPVRSPELRQ